MSVKKYQVYDCSFEVGEKSRMNYNEGKLLKRSKQGRTDKTEGSSYNH